MKMECALFFLWLLIMCVVNLGPAVAVPCPVLNNQARCIVNVGDIPVHTNVIVNRCHQPVDVTFLLKVDSPAVEWKHTFVITNSAESQEVSGLLEKLFLHVTTSSVEPKEVLLTAEFLAPEQHSVVFMNSTVLLVVPQNCKHLGSTYISHVVAGVMMPLLLLVLSIGSFLLYCKCKKSTMDQLTLVENMAGIPGASPYQEGNPTVSFRKHELEDQELIIENSFVTSRNESTA